MDLTLIIGAIVGVGLLAWLVTYLTSGTSDDAVRRRFEKIPNFRITEAHAHEGTGMAADEAEARILILGKDQTKLALVGIKDLIGWHYLPKGDEYVMEIRTRRHRQPFEVLFAKRGEADLWIKILTVLAKRQ